MNRRTRRQRRADYGGQSYFLEVFGFETATNPNYTLRLDGPSAPAIEPDRFESNDAFETATDLGPLGDVTVGGLSIHVQNDVDFFRFTAMAGGSVFVDVITANGLRDLRAIVTDANGNWLEMVAVEAPHERVRVEVSSGHTYFVLVFAVLNPVNPNYTLGIDGPSAATISPDRFEPNDTASQATDLGSADRTETNLSIHTPGELDWYRFTAVSSGVLTVDVLFSHAGGDIDAAILDANQILLSSSHSVDDDEQMSLNVTAGTTYYVAVYGVTRGIFDTAVNPNYTLRIDAPSASADPIPVRPVVRVENGKLIVEGAGTDDVVSITGIGAGSGVYELVTAQGAQTVSGVTSDIVVRLLGGNDRVTMNNAYVNGAIDIQTGDGHDTVVLGDQDVVSSRTELRVDLGAGNDTLDGKRLYIGTNQVINGGDGDDRLFFDGFLSPTFTLGTSAAGAATWSGGRGNDTVHVVYAFVVGQFTVDLGDGADSLDVYGSAVSAAVQFLGSAGDDALRVDTNFFDSNLTLNGGNGLNSLFLANGLGTETATLIGGTGRDSVLVQNQTASDLHVDTGAGDDEVEIRSSAFDRFFAALGDDNDQLSVHGNLSRMEAHFDGGLGELDRLLDLGNSFLGAYRKQGFELLG